MAEETRLAQTSRLPPSEDRVSMIHPHQVEPVLRQQVLPKGEVGT